MSQLIVYVDRSEVRPGKLEELKGAIHELAALVEAGEPDLLAYRAHLNEDGTEVTVLHIHRDSASLETHARVAGPAFARFRELVNLRRIDLYGVPDGEVVERMREKARLLGSGVVEVHDVEAGFSRLGGRSRPGRGPADRR